ncbi:MAG: (2Fe-2S)-binding protein [Chthoniobacterales bacterium]
MKRVTNIDSGFVCHCARIRHSELLEIFSEATDPSYEEFKARYGIGGQCASCEYEVKAILDDYLAVHGRPAPRVEVAAPVKPPAVPLRKRLRSFAESSKRSIFPKVNGKACMFFIIDGQLQSSLVVSNINNPESNINPNRDNVSFRVLIYDGEGKLVHQTGKMSVGPNETVELFPEEIFDRVPEHIVGSLYVEYYNLECTNTLRPYCVLNYTDANGRIRSRQHYHDKLYTKTIPGFVQCPSAFPPGRVCWLALTNCSPRDFNATLNLRLGDEVKKVQLHFGPQQTVFRSIPEVFGMEIPPEGRRDAHFWIESEHYVMTYFFWNDIPTDVWFGQHH